MNQDIHKVKFHLVLSIATIGDAEVDEDGISVHINKPQITPYIYLVHPGKETPLSKEDLEHLRGAIINQLLEACSQGTKPVGLKPEFTVPLHDEPDPKKRQ